MNLGLLLGKICQNSKHRRIRQRWVQSPSCIFSCTNQTLDEPLWKSLFRNIDDFFFPKKLPPLVLTSKPVPVRDIWGFYNYKGRGAAGSTVIHVLALAAIIAGTYLGRRIVDVAKPKETVVLIAPDDIPALPPSKTVSGGGGGGGDRDKLQASPGRLPKQSMQQITPPAGSGAQPGPETAQFDRRSWFLPTLTCSSPTCPTWAIRCRICRRCLRMELAMAAALAPAAVAASVRAKVPDMALVTAAAPVAECSAWAVVFPLRKRFIARS